jgi:hypothetical protein
MSIKGFFKPVSAARHVINLQRDNLNLHEHMDREKEKQKQKRASAIAGAKVANAVRNLPLANDLHADEIILPPGPSYNLFLL